MLDKKPQHIFAHGQSLFRPLRKAFCYTLPNSFIFAFAHSLIGQSTASHTGTAHFPKHFNPSFCQRSKPFCHRSTTIPAVLFTDLLYSLKQHRFHSQIAVRANPLPQLPLTAFIHRSIKQTKSIRKILLHRAQKHAGQKTLAHLCTWPEPVNTNPQGFLPYFAQFIHFRIRSFIVHSTASIRLAVRANPHVLLPLTAFYHCLIRQTKSIYNNPSHRAQKPTGQKPKRIFTHVQSLLRPTHTAFCHTLPNLLIFAFAHSLIGQSTASHTGTAHFPKHFNPSFCQCSKPFGHCSTTIPAVLFTASLYSLVIAPLPFAGCSQSQPTASTASHSFCPSLD